MLAFATLLSLGSCAPSLAKDLTDNEIRDILVRASIATYSGACACPESRNRRGEACGETSAYKTKGASGILCYRADVKPEMIKRFRELSK